jgi:hypothetical protein
VRFGAGRISELAAACAAIAGIETSALLVTDRGAGDAADDRGRVLEVLRGRRAGAARCSAESGARTRPAANLSRPGVAAFKRGRA